MEPNQSPLKFLSKDHLFKMSQSVGQPRDGQGRSSSISPMFRKRSNQICEDCMLTPTTAGQFMGGNRDLESPQVRQRSKTTDKERLDRKKVFNELIGEFNQKEIDMFINQRRNNPDSAPNGPAEGPSEVTEQQVRNIYHTIEKEFEPKKKFCKYILFIIKPLQLIETGCPKIHKKSHKHLR